MRRRRTVFEDLIVIAAKLPWQIGLLLALLSFIGLHSIAVHFTTPVVASGNGDLGVIYTHTLLATVARLAQLIVPPVSISKLIDSEERRPASAVDLGWFILWPLWQCVRVPALLLLGRH